MAVSADFNCGVVVYVRLVSFVMFLLMLQMPMWRIQIITFQYICRSTEHFIFFLCFVKYTWPFYLVFQRFFFYLVL